MTKQDSIKITIYHPHFCPRCLFTKKRLTVPFKDVEVDREKDGATLQILRDKGFTSFPVVFVYQEGKIIDSWSGYNEKKIDEYNIKLTK